MELHVVGHERVAHDPAGGVRPSPQTSRPLRRVAQAGRRRWRRPHRFEADGRGNIPPGRSGSAGATCTSRTASPTTATRGDIRRYSGRREAKPSLGVCQKRGRGRTGASRAMRLAVATWENRPARPRGRAPPCQVTRGARAAPGSGRVPSAWATSCRRSMASCRSTERTSGISCRASSTQRTGPLSMGAAMAVLGRARWALLRTATAPARPLKVTVSAMTDVNRGARGINDEARPGRPATAYDGRLSQLCRAVQLPEASW